MKKYFLISIVTMTLAGCAGLDITPISPSEEASAHAGNSTLKGYVIYEPMVVVEVTNKEVCREKDDKGNCKETPEIACSAGSPFTLPDPSKPFLLNTRSGFGKAGVDVTITNGWQLGNLKDNSDNTAILGTIEKLAGSKSYSATSSISSNKCKAPGLYRVNIKDSAVELTPLLVY